jgi:short-subunit dehydrogenase
MSARRFRAVLTGAAGGIGSEIARTLAPRCDALLLVGRNAGRLADLQRRLRDPGTRIVEADVASAAGRDAVAAAARDVAGGVDLLINNAGASAFAWLADQDDEALERMVRTNLLAPMQLTRALLPLLETQTSAYVVNVGSIFGYLGYPGCAAYSATKFGLRGFSEALRRELADGPVRVMYLAPRSTRTPANSDAMYALNERLRVAVDDPRVVARALMRLLRARRGERLMGFPERLFARMNQLAPGLVDGSLRRKLPVIRAHARNDGIPPARPRRG